MARSRVSGILTWLIVLALLAGGGWAAWRWRQQRTATAAAPILKTNAVVRGDIIQSVTANGALNPVRVVSVGSQISGIITEMNVDFNSQVKAGQVLAKIDPSTYERDLAGTEANLSSAKAGLALDQRGSMSSARSWRPASGVRVGSDRTRPSTRSKKGKAFQEASASRASIRRGSGAVDRCA